MDNFIFFSLSTCAFDLIFYFCLRFVGSRILSQLAPWRAESRGPLGDDSGRCRGHGCVGRRCRRLRVSARAPADAGVAAAGEAVLRCRCAVRHAQHYRRSDAKDTEGRGEVHSMADVRGYVSLMSGCCFHFI